ALRMPQRLTPSVHSKSDGGRSHMNPPVNTPALLHSSSVEPNVSYVCSASASTSSKRETSATNALVPSRPSTVSASAIPSTSAATTRMPSAASRRTSARPIPLPAPVTTATLSRSCSIAASWQRMHGMSERVDKLVADLTLDEKAALAAGVDLWYG